MKRCATDERERDPRRASANGYPKRRDDRPRLSDVASTLLHEQSWTHQVIERQLAPAERNAVSADYNFAERLPERRKMMQAWDDYLDALKANAHLIPLLADYPLTVSHKNCRAKSIGRSAQKAFHKHGRRTRVFTRGCRPAFRSGGLRPPARAAEPRRSAPTAKDSQKEVVSSLIMQSHWRTSQLLQGIFEQISDGRFPTGAKS